jgi:hypothetical protein
MDLLKSDTPLIFCIALVALSAVLAVMVWVMFKLVNWGKTMSKGAYLFLAFFPLISILPIPPPTYENVQKAKQEQRKRKGESGDPLEGDDEIE